MAATREEIFYIQKITRAEEALKRRKVRHQDGCRDDLDSHEPCRCGASATNSAIDAALAELKLL